MSELFNLRSFVETQVERLASPTNLLVDKFRQTVDIMKYPFTSNDSTPDEVPQRTLVSELSFEVIPSDFSSNSLEKLAEPDMNSTEMNSHRLSFLRRYASESNRSDERYVLQPTFHTNPPINVHLLLNPRKKSFSNNVDRSRSLIRQSTDTTCTYPIRPVVRRLESIEIPGLNGVKSIRYIDDDLGRLQPELYRKPQNHPDSSNNAGQLTITLFYNQSTTCLVITVVSIDRLPARDHSGKLVSNPFVKINLLPDRRKKFQTKVYKHSSSIECNETFYYSISYEQLIKRTLLLSIHDFCRSIKRSVIGTIKIDQFDMMPELMTKEITCTEMIVPETEFDPDLGELTVSLCYLPNAKRVTVTIIKANSLKPMDITGKSDPYVKVLLLIHGKKIRKRKTSVVFNSLNPIYNESIEFNLSHENLEHADLLFKVIDYDRVGSNELIGCLGLGSHFEGIHRDHWCQMIENPRVPLVETYPLCETIPTLNFRK